MASTLFNVIWIIWKGFLEQSKSNEEINRGGKKGNEGLLNSANILNPDLDSKFVCRMTDVDN